MSNLTTSNMEPTLIAPGFLLRIGGLPLSTVAGLGSAALDAALARAQELEQLIASRATAVSDALYHAIPKAEAEPDAQKALLNLRRAVFNGRAIAAASLAAAEKHLPQQDLQALHDWQALRAELENHEAQAEALTTAELPRMRRALKEAAAVPQFRKGLLVANPAFERTLDDYLRADDGQINRKLRQAERTLLLYLLRTTHKTSPLSTLTMVSVGRFGDGTAMAPQWSSWQPHHATKPNVATLSRVSRTLSGAVARHPGLRLALQDGATRANGRLHYWKRSEIPLTAGGPMHSTVSEASFSLHLTGSLELVLDLLAQGPRSAGEMIALLGERLDMSETQAADYLQRLVDHGLLTVHGLRQSVFENNVWARFADELESSGEPGLCEAAQALRRAGLDVTRFAQAGLGERATLMRSINDTLGQALAHTGTDAPPPQPVLYEDTSASPQPISASADAWRGALDQLGELQRLVGLFDPMLISRVTLCSLFRKRYGVGGVCRDVAGFSDFFHDSFYRSVSANSRMNNSSSPFGRGTLNPLKLPEITAIQDAQTELIAAVDEALASHDGSGDIELPVELVQRLGTQAMGWQKWMSNAFFVQKSGTDDDPQLILNRIYAGAGCTFGRFAHLYDGPEAQPARTLLRENLAAMQGDDMLFAELQGGHETNLNLHPMLSDVELVLPGERGSADPAGRITLAELSIRHDAERDRLTLYCERLGKRIVPLYLGMLYPLILPELQTLLLHFSPPAILRTDVFARSQNSGEGTAFLPRIRYRSVLLERARWEVPAAQVPQRAGGESDYRYMRRLAAWREETGLPAQVFVKAMDLAVKRASSEQIGGYGFGNKPVYVDFAQPLCVGLFEHIAAGATGHLVFSERLPANDDALAAPDGQHHTHEFIFELTQGSLK